MYYREDVVPAFREHMKTWIEDAELLVGCDVWERVDEELQIRE